MSRLTAADWEKLKADLTARRVRVVALDLPTSWTMMTGNGDDFTARMFDAINGMLLDMLAAVARKDYDDRRRRQAQGQVKAMALGKYKGRPEDVKRNAFIAHLLTEGRSWKLYPGHDGMQPRHGGEGCQAHRRRNGHSGMCVRTTLELSTNGENGCPPRHGKSATLKAPPQRDLKRLCADRAV